ncbi:MAG: Cysteine--tRNA ligase [Syntrophorhabdaceae bacterium PtaU1.Bin034]|nr:MAG: Cysteine--tRNA ligase [Syntrophorhabdaceae bacterium PtaU1.Bin034]
MALKIYDSMTHEKHDFVPVKSGHVGLYVCGVTVYDHSHIGHARAAIVFDVVSRYLRSVGYDVTYVRNFTDIDDKIINRANSEGRDWREIAETYIDSYREDMASLGILPPNVEPKATEHIGDMIALIEQLVQKGVAYQAGGSVYFSVNKDKGYGMLSGRTPDEMLAGVRIEIDERKKDPLDFALWKESKPGEPSWDSPFGKGRPGWHIECSTMSIKYLGSPFDMHGGGKDLVFPHHENERAQAECATGRKFVNYWVHNGFVTMDREKMSKSIGNILLIKDFVKTYDPEVLRLFFLSAHYRNPVDYTEKSIENADNALQRLYATLERISEVQGLEASSPESNEELDALEKKFYTAMDDDFNTALALSSIFDLATVINRMIDEGVGKSLPFILRGKQLLLSLANLLGLLTHDVAAFNKAQADRHLAKVGFDEAQIEDAIKSRADARASKDYRRADDIRNMLLEKGITLLDTAQGTKWRIKK